MSHACDEKRITEAKAAEEKSSAVTKEQKLACIQRAQQLAAACDYAQGRGTPPGR